MSMCSKVLALVVIVVAVVLAALASFLPVDKIEYVIAASRFFEIMIPTLVVGALIKYLCKCSAGCNCPCCRGKQGCDDKGSCG